MKIKGGWFKCEACEGRAPIQAGGLCRACFEKKPAPRQPLVVSYGMGVDSTAMLVGMAQRGIRPDAILFADTGDEKPATYAYLERMNAWLDKVGFPRVTVIVYRVKDFKNWPEYRTLEENCLTNGTLPSEAFGFGSCSMKCATSA